MCENSFDSAGYRRCRYNYGARACENMPEKYRESATMQVSKANPYVKYVPGAAKRVTIPEKFRDTPKVNPLMLSGAVQRLKALGTSNA